MSSDLSPSLENYLEEMLLLEEEKKEVRVTDLAERLDIAKSSVNQAVSRLAKSKLVECSRYSPIRLTPAGRQKAKEICNKHFLLKSFLEDILQVNASVAEVEACRMEHILSRETLQKLKRFMEEYRKNKGASS